jgi:hypothetical protein
MNPLFDRLFERVGALRAVGGGLEKIQIILISLVIPRTPPKASRPNITSGVSKLIQNATREYLRSVFFTTIPSNHASGLFRRQRQSAYSETRPEKSI